ncbi:424_t:CDS:1 [Funneliformis geosporum]|uniref:12180_t:CDS:1 n=1 Tax=Funneliformis geosporum TaxID=1117311 RepID=A0A9W4SI97_9GLOM|nr:12180_t:CDS:1 [Funneliformis geosporum]CAI2170638.1 424_t:CDS:1 [Funneliformis geosporum]
MAKSNRKQVNTKRKPTSKRNRNIPNIEINLPFPPKVELEDLFPKSKAVSLRTLNAFFIYRKVITAEIKKNHVLCWSIISNIASSRWRIEDPGVKQHYRELAEHVKVLYRSKHPLYVHHGKKAAESVIMLQDNDEKTVPKQFIFVNEFDSNNNGADQQDASDQVQVAESLIDQNRYDYEQNISSYTVVNPPNTSAFDLVDFLYGETCNYSMTTLLHDEELIYSMLNGCQFLQDREGHYT